MALLKPEEVLIDHPDGDILEFKIHRLPATVGREIAYQYLTANLPKVGNYELSKKLLDTLMEYVTVSINGVDTQLKSDDLIDNHCGHWQVVSKLEDEMLRYNTDFLADGKASIFSILCQTAVKAWLTPIQTDSLEQS